VIFAFRSKSIPWSRGLVRLGLALAMGLATFTATAKEKAPDYGPTMRFVVVRSSAQGCEPNCPEWISAEGTIEAGTPALFKRMLKTLGRRQLPIVVNSPGGNVDAALQLGRMIRKANLDIGVGATIFYGCEPQMKDCRANDGKGADYFGLAYAEGAMCNSACPLMFAGGIRRVVGEWAYLGVHQITTTFRRERLFYRTTYRIENGRKKVLSTKIVGRKNAGSYKTYEMSKPVEKRLSAYLKEMGIDQGVLDTMKATPASDISRIKQPELLATKLITSLDTVDLFTQGGLCRRNPVPANCRDIPANAKPAPATTIEVKAVPAQPVEAPAAKTAPPTSAAAASENEAPEMRFVVVRGGNPLCNPDCPEWISAQGAITPQTPQRLSQLLATLGGRHLPLVISSRGGDLFSALATGRIAHEKKLDIAVARTDFVGCDPTAWNCLANDGAYAGLTVDTGGECDSACALVLAGGARRLVGAKARLSMYLMGQKQVVKAYLDEMAINPALFATLQRTSVEGQLDPEMMLKTGLTTGRQSVDALTGATICKSSPKPDNCRVLPSTDVAAKSQSKL